MIGSYLNEWNIVTITVRLILAVVCGGAIGLTRSVKRRGAGFKTHALVCLGSALVMMTGQYIYVDFGAISDIARLAAQVISGVGFLGVGTIMVTRDNHVLVIYRFMGRVDEIAYEHSRVLDIYIEFESRRSIAPFISVLKENNYKIMQMELNKSKKNKEELVNATLVLEVPEKTKHGIVIDLLREIPGIEYVEEI